ncbi:MAG: UvrD-helicase domain-containing protein [Actinomycetota bacterium]
MTQNPSQGAPTAHPEDLLADLNPVQRDAVLATEGPVLIVAGAGSGKTRVITYRVAHLLRSGVRPRQVLAITFTNKAAGEMRERIRFLVGSAIADDMWIMTFHSCCARILRYEAEQLGFGRNFTIYDEQDAERVVSSILKDLNLDLKRWTPRSLKHAISQAKNVCVSAAELAQVASGYAEQTAARVYELYESRLKQANALDFDDLLMRTVQLFESKPEVLAKWQERFRYIVIDEYQDTNHAQYRVVSLVAAKYRNLCVVGDEDQSVYAFRGATIRNILEFERDYPDAKVFKLEQNYRSTQNILDAANALIRNNTQRKDKKLFTDLGKGTKAVRYQADDEHDEAHFVAGEINRLTSTDVGGVSGGRSVAPLTGKDVAVFYRTNAQSRVLEETFLRYGLPYRVVGGLKFYDRKEVRDAIAYLRAAHNPADRVSVVRATGAPKRGVGDTSMERITEWALANELPLADAFARADEIPGLTGRAKGGAFDFSRILRLIRDRDAAGAPLGDVVRTAFEDSGLLESFKAENTIESQSRVENLLELAGVAEEFEKAAKQEGAEARLADFLERTSLVSEVDLMADTDEVITMMTLHNAKGLEYPIVFLTGLEEGVFPHIRSMSEPDQLEEERRLAYVGITRAQKLLYLTHAWSRSLWGGTNYNPQSRFIGEIPEELIDVLREAERPRDRGWNSRWEPKVKRPREPEGMTIRVARGDRVLHEAFGAGEVVEVSGSGNDTEVVVNFDDEGQKRLVLAYANLTKAG